MKAFAIQFLRSGKVPRFIARMLVWMDSRFISFFSGYGIQRVYPYYDEDLRVIVSTDNLSRKMIRKFYEKDTTNVIEKCIKSGNYCLDIGANVGPITLLLAKRVGAGGRVYAFEPGFANYVQLLQNIEMNPQLKRIIIPINLGIAKTTSEQTWVEDQSNLGNAFVVANDNASTRAPGGHTHLIQSVSLDAFFNLIPLSRLDFIKIDVEGLEWEVIQSAKLLIEKFRPIIYFETINTQALEDKTGDLIYQKIDAYLRLLNYRLYSADDNVFREVHYPKYSKNTLALPGSLEDLNS